MTGKRRHRRHASQLFISAAVLIAAAGFLIFFWRKTEQEMNRLSEAEPAVFTEAAISETENPDNDNSKDMAPDATETPLLTTETFLRQETERIRNLAAGELAADGMLAAEQIAPLFYASGVNDTVYARINGSSYTQNPDIQPSELSYLKMLYYGFDGNTYVGEMIVNQKIESEILQIFKTLYENKYPIEKMVLIDNYDADDTLSMEDNNTSAFNYRTISGSSKLSNHSYGMAVDLNPKYNPYVKTASDGSIICQPEGGREYADRSKDFAYKIDENDLAYRLFTEAGFTWGGNWNSVKDYQHFEK